MLAPVTSLFTFLASLMTLIIGIVNVSTKFDSWCEKMYEDNEDVECVGPSLFWSRAGCDSNKFCLNEEWYAVTSFAPSKLAEMWTPTVFGLIGVAFHWAPIRINALCCNWARLMCFFVINALFSNLGFAGRWGVCSGFFSLLVALLCLITHFVAGEANTSAGHHYGALARR